MLKLFSAASVRVAGFVLGLGAVMAGGAAAQSGTVRVAQENFRAEPGGAVLAEVMEGAVLALGEARGRWREATLEGWVWAPALREDRRYGHELIVDGGAAVNLRSSPNGSIRAQLHAGMRLDRMEALNDWIRVRRVGWIWEPSLEITVVAEPAPLPAPAPDSPGAQSRPALPPDSGGGAGAPADTSAGGAPASGPPVSATEGDRDWAVVGSDGLVVLDSPAGDTLARIRPGSGVQVVGREGEWTRVRIEGWTRTPSLATSETSGAAVLRDVDPSSLVDQPEDYRGRLIEWEVQFIALRVAERFRSDFLEGEPFILARGPGDRAGFIYAAVPPSLLEDVRQLTALQWIRIVGRVRSVRSSLTGAPVLELLELETVGL